jgi:hypothetical protein
MLRNKFTRTCALASLSVLLATTGAQAADLGGDCCADLEERIAELEATTARKGNRKYRSPSPVMLRGDHHWDDGGGQHLLTVWGRRRRRTSSLTDKRRSCRLDRRLFGIQNLNDNHSVVRLICKIR